MRGTIPVSEINVSYEEWTELLGSFFFDTSHDGDEVLFTVDDLALSEITGLPDHVAAASLSQAVRSVIKSHWDVNQVKYKVRRWRYSEMEGDHPALPFLALTVLAASRMQADGDVAASNFYVPLRKALNPTDSDTGVPGTYLENVRNLWDDLAKWANEDLGGHRGRLGLRDPGPQYGRGAAVQHALVRGSDLSQLDTFFRRIGLQPGEGAVGKELLRALRIWTDNRQEPWARRLHRLSSDSELSDYAAALLERQAARWDGRPRDRRSGRAVGQIRLGVSRLRQPELGIYLCGDSRLPQELKIAGSSSEGLVIKQIGDWFQPSPLKQPDIGSVLVNGLQLSAGQWRFEFRPEDAYPLTYDDELGLWVSVDSISFGDRYHVLVRQDLANEVRTWMSKVSATPPKENSEANSRLPHGWAMLQDLQLERRPRHSPPACLASAIPTGSGPRLRLVGGLPLTAGYAVYLRGGEPGLALSSLVADREVTITQESTGKTETLRVGENREEEIPLWKFQLAPGTYTANHGETSVKFQIVDGIAEVAGPGAGSIHLTVDSNRIVVGTSPEPPSEVALPPTVRAPHPGETVLILGQHSSNFVKIESPSWITSFAGPLSWSQIDFWNDFQPVWQLTKRASDRMLATLLVGTEPSADCDDQSLWAKAIRGALLPEQADEATQELWSRYRDAAKEKQ